MSTMSIPQGVNLPPSARDARVLEELDVTSAVGDPAQMMQRLMAFRNERVLHRRTCDFSGAAILSAYPPETKFPVYRNDIWWGDGWNPLDYGRDYDFSRGFFEQVAELQAVVPREGTSVFNSENCDYNGHIRQSRNCYMNSLVHNCEDTHYSYWVVNDTDVVDCYLVNNSTLAYDCIDGENLYNCVRLQDCTNCRDCYFSYQLVGCSNCIACSGLHQKQYHVFNKPVSKEEFTRLRDQLIDGTASGFDRGEQLFAEMWQNARHRCAHNLNCENVIGDHLLNCKNCQMCFESSESEDCAYSISFADSKDIRYSYSAGWPRCEQVFNSVVTRGSTDILCCYYTFYSSNLRYCDSSMSCHNCFGCIGLKQKRNCVLNKEYSAEEYKQLTEKIVSQMKESGEWGQFFPAELSTFAYNHTAAQEYFPMSQDEALQAGWRWEDIPDPQYDMEVKAFPEQAIADIPDDVTNWTFRCQETDKPFRIAKSEFAFYRKMNLPLPRYCLDARHRRRIRSRNPHQIVQRVCADTGAEVWSSFPLESDVQVYSEESYLEHLG